MPVPLAIYFNTFWPLVCEPLVVVHKVFWHCHKTLYLGTYWRWVVVSHTSKSNFHNKILKRVHTLTDVSPLFCFPRMSLGDSPLLTNAFKNCTRMRRRTLYLHTSFLPSFFLTKYYKFAVFGFVRRSSVTRL